ncbi:MAG: insulinase family protein [Treponema sp.]|jgi:zinc protease|nr:insulinase family protein [Treponema sp.]
MNTYLLSKAAWLRFFLFIMAGLVLPAVLYANPEADKYGGLGRPSDPAPFMEKAWQGTLPNGLRYYILENARPENRAFLTLAVNAGSVLETESERGLAHFVEHMAFNGTERFPEAELLAYLNSIGMRLGSDANAYTGFDSTVYSIETPIEMVNGVKKIPEKALAIIDDWSYAITFTPQDVDEERGVIMEEYRMNLGAVDRVIRQQLLPILFKDSRYAVRLPIGLPEIIQTASAEQLKAFYQRWYQPDNMAIIFVGDFDGAALEAELAAHFTAPKPATPTVRPEYNLAPPKPATFSTATFTDPEFPFRAAYLYYKLPQKKVGTDLAAFRELIIDKLIAQMIGSRFSDVAAKSDAPYLDAGTMIENYGASSRFYVLVAEAKSGGFEDAIRALLLEKKSIERYGFTDAEIDRAKRVLLSSLQTQDSERDRIDSDLYVSQLIEHFLRDELVPGVSWELDAVQRLLPGITARDIALAARAYFAANELSLFILAPDSELPLLPSKTQVQQLVVQTAVAPIAPPTNEDLGEELLEEEPVPGFIVAEALDEETGALIWELSNGATVILKETANQNNQITLVAQARGGITSAAVEQSISARLSSELLNASGMGPYTQQELSKKLAGKQVSVGFENSAWTRTVNGSASTNDLKTLFELLYLGFTHPRIDADIITVILEQYRAILTQRMEVPIVYYSDEINRVIAGNNPYFMPLTVTDLDRVNLDEALSFARRALNPADYVFTFVGNIDIAAMWEYTEAYLAAIPSDRERFNEWENTSITRPGQMEENIYKGREEQSYVYMAYFNDEPFSEADNAVSEALTEYLEIVLMREIREKLGGVYSITAPVSLQPLPPDEELQMNIFFGCDPNRVTELRAAVKAQLELIANGDIDADTFAKALEILKNIYERNLQSNNYIAQSYSNSAVIYQSPLSRLNQRLSFYEALTPADIQAMVVRLLPNGPAEFMLYPENWK